MGAVRWGAITAANDRRSVPTCRVWLIDINGSMPSSWIPEPSESISVDLAADDCALARRFGVARMRGATAWLLAAGCEVAHALKGLGFAPSPVAPLQYRIGWSVGLGSKWALRLLCAQEPSSAATTRPSARGRHWSAPARSSRAARGGT